MRTKKVPIFLEFMKKSFFIISLILFIYTIGQVITFWMFTDEYERDLLKDRYEEIISLSQDINVQISESGFYEYLQKSNYNFYKICFPKYTRDAWHFSIYTGRYIFHFKGSRF